jgi:anti-sigma factor ChrR (cupin superfamily)
MAKVFISCEKATELIERKIDGELKWGDRLSLSFHTMMCGLCRMYEKQSQRLHRFLANQHKEEVESRPMSQEEVDALKAKIKAGLEEE